MTNLPQTVAGRLALIDALTNPQLIEDEETGEMVLHPPVIQLTPEEIIELLDLPYE